MEHRLSLESILEASRTIDLLFLQSPQFEIETLSRELGCRLTLKVETTNPIRSFKGRGADYFLSKITERKESRDLVCASTGNFGQAMAYACRKRNRPLMVYADVNANESKLERIADLGATVRQVGEDFDAAKLAAKEHCDSSGAWMIEDGLQPEISEGAGSIAVELLADQDFDVVLVPVGNGALITGVGRYVKEKSPETEVIGVSASAADAMEQSWRGDSILETPSANTIAEGIAVRVPVPAAVEDMRTTVDEMNLVEDDRMIEGMRLLHKLTGLVVEPSGATGIAAILDSPDDFADKRVATVLTGSNVTPAQIEAWLC